MMIFSCCLLFCFAPSMDGLRSAHIARQIDKLLEQKYLENAISPNPIVDDLTFLRRVSLDLVGRIPTLEEIHRFQLSPDRENIIDELVDSPEFNVFVSEAWTTWLIGYSNVFQTDRETFRIWLQDELRQNRSFKSIVTQILTAEGSTAINGPTNFLARHFDQPATAICRSFLGVRLECAQCHDHPFDRWTQQDYELMQRFFRPMRRKNENGTAEIYDENIRPQENERPVFLTGSKPRTQRYRQELALYLTNCKPFARNYANRTWYFLMGKGIVDPPDDFNQENPPIDKELLEFLSQTAQDTNFDIKQLVKVICKTKAYQRTVANSESSQKSIQMFAVKTVKPVLPIQYLDSLVTALERDLSFTQRNELLRQLVNVQDINEDYQRIWDYRESVQQLMNKVTFDFGNSREGVHQAPLQELFLRLLTRAPTDEELVICADKNAADIIFGLALSNEFFFNH